MLVYDPDERASAYDLLRHPWLYEACPSENTIIDVDLIASLKSFIEKQTFLKLLSYQYATRWKDTYCGALQENLETIDTDRDGVVSL